MDLHEEQTVWSGDPYSAAGEDVQRGVSLLPFTDSELSQFEFGSDMHPLIGQGEVTRGVSLSPADCEGPGWWGDVGHGDKVHDGFGNDDFFSLGGDFSFQEKCVLPEVGGKSDGGVFTGGTFSSSIPDLPEDPYFSLESTTLEFSLEGTLAERIGAHKLGRDLLDFFQFEAEASILKVCYKKFAVKASVLFEGLSCTVKARFYKRDHHRVALQFQRKSGDVVAFDATFARLGRLFQEMGYLHDGDAQVSPFSPRLRFHATQEPDAFDQDTFGPFGPIYDLANSDDPALHAEAAQGTSDIGAARQLCSAVDMERITNALNQLGGTPTPEQTLPLRCLLTRISNGEMGIPEDLNPVLDTLLQKTCSGTGVESVPVVPRLGSVC